MKTPAFTSQNCPQLFKFWAVSLLSLSAVSQAAGANLITNGDFSQTYDPVGWASSLPTGWGNFNGSTDNAAVVSGVLRFATGGQHNTNHKYYTTQTFDAGAGGSFNLSFDYFLENAYWGQSINGARVVIDNWYTTTTTTPNIVFQKTFGSETNPSAWHLGQTVELNLTAGLHTLYIGTIGATQPYANAIVHYDNVFITSTSAVPEPETYALMLAGLGLMGSVARRRKAKQG